MRGSGTVPIAKAASSTTNARYATVKAKVGQSAAINSGPSVLHQRTITVGQLAKRRGEVFGRISPEVLAELLIQLNTKTSNGTSSAASSPESALRVSKVDQHARCERPTIIVLDVRDRGEFLESHLYGSTHFSLHQLRQDKFPPELYTAKRSACSVIIVAATESRESVEVASNLARNMSLGLDSVLLLTGGLRDLLALDLPPMLFTAPSRSASAGSTGSEGIATTTARSFERSLERSLDPAYAYALSPR